MSVPQKTAPTYEQDYYGWLQQQVHLLRRGQLEVLDIQNVAEELEALGRQERRELEHRHAILIAHLLKWQVQPQGRSNSWKASIRQQRRQIARLLTRNPSLQPYKEEAMDVGFQDGLDLAAGETNLPDEAFPSVCPYSWPELTDSQFWPSGEL
jgi:ribosomal protein L29